MHRRQLSYARTISRCCTSGHSSRLSSSFQSLGSLVVRSRARAAIAFQPQSLHFPPAPTAARVTTMMMSSTATPIPSNDEQPPPTTQLGTPGIAQAAAAAAAASVVLHNGVLDTGPQARMSAKELLKSGPRGAYTTARTVGIKNVFELDLHMRRLQESCALIFAPPTDATNNSGSSQDQEHFARVLATIPARTAEAMRSAFKAFDAQFPSCADHERRVTVLVSVVRQASETAAEAESSAEPEYCLDIHTHVGLLPPVPAPPVKIHIVGDPRGNAKAKDSQWVTQRQSLERTKPADVDELVLGDHKGHLYEGTQTNFFVVRAGKVITAKDHILEGTVRALVLQLCEEEGIPVVFEPPLASEINEWDEAWIASTSRLVLPVDFIASHDSEDATRILQERWMPKQRPVGTRVLALVKSHLEAASLPLWDDA